MIHIKIKINNKIKIRIYRNLIKYKNKAVLIIKIKNMKNNIKMNI